LTDTPAERGAESTWVSLRRRKVVQWGLAYAAGAWVLLQVLGFAADAFAWPAITKQLAMLGLAVGLPIVVALAWFHGDRGQQRVTGPELAVLTLLLFLGGGLLWVYAQRSTTTAAAVKPSPTAVAADARPSIAVLPFENRSREGDDAFFVDGIHDDILTQLTKVGALKVIARTSVEQFRDTTLTTKEIGEKLGVTKVLEGGVQRAGDRVRVTVQLIDAATDAHLWAENYDRELSAANIFAIQSEVATAIAGALRAALTTSERARIDAIPTQSLEAWQAYQLGKQRMGSRTSTSLSQAEEHFRKATSLDPKFALAWAGLADALMLQTAYSGRTRDAVLGDAEAAVTRALELDPNLAEAWASTGLIALNGSQLDRAEQTLRRVIGLNPNYAPALQWLSSTLGYLGQRAEALSLMEHAVALDPLSAVVNRHLGTARSNVGRFDDALIAYKQAIEFDPTMASAYMSVGDVHADGLGRYDTAIAWYEKAARLDPGAPGILASLAQAHWDLGDDTAAGRWLARSLAVGEGRSYANAVAALLYLDRGDEASACRYAQRAAELDPLYTYLVRDEDLRKSDYATARARYAKAYPELFAKELPTIKSDGAAYAAINGRMLRGAQTAPEQVREVLAAADRISWLPSREWNVALLEAHAALMSGDRRRAVVQAQRALGMMTVERDALLGPANMVAAATVLAWAGEGRAAVQILRHVIDVPSGYVGWALVRDPLLAVPLAGNPAFEGFKREVDPTR
jgi:TolB-like protein/cytochrome c-type biogenesis protein CcmH/NrfG